MILNLTATPIVPVASTILQGIKNNTHATNELKTEIIKVILNAVKNLAVSTYFQPRIDLEILRYAQDDFANWKLKSDKCGICDAYS